MDGDKIAQKSLELAEGVFAKGRKIIMAHAIQAAESMVFERRKSISSDAKPFAIQVNLRPNVIKINRKRAVMFLKEHIAEIVIDSSLSLEDRRKAIAHELGHILIGDEVRGAGGGLLSRSDPEHESWCRDFEELLCQLLHMLYTTTDFHNDTHFPSISAICQKREKILLEILKRTDTSRN